MVRRFLVLAALFFWQGGFTFYAAVVVPIGQIELGSHEEQGFITRQVTWYLNWSGAIALVPLAWDLLVSRDPARWRRWALGLLWLVMALTLLLLFWQHGWLEELLNIDEHLVINHQAFRPRHRIYLWTSTIQWAAALGFMLLMLRSWQVQDRGVTREVREPPLKKTTAVGQE